MNRTTHSQSLRAVGQERFYRGQYAVCRLCGCRPCADDCPGEDAAPVVDQAAARPPQIETSPDAAGRPQLGRAIDFRIWDELIERCELDVYSSGILLWCYRETHGRGLHWGAPLSKNAIAAATRCSARTVAYHLLELERSGLIVRTRRHPRGRRCWDTSIVEVVLPSTS